jgi:hypothetical protein
MLVEFEKMPSDARVWIYQANNALSESSKKMLSEKITSFLTEWESHGNNLKASWKLFFDRFLVLAVDEKYNAISGCSIDKSVRYLRSLESDLDTSFLEKSSIAVYDKNHISTFELKDLKKLIKEGKINQESIIFNNLVPTLADLDTNWQQPAKQTWLSRYFNT